MFLINQKKNLAESKCIYASLIPSLPLYPLPPRLPEPVIQRNSVHTQGFPSRLEGLQ